jgi:hypothetical protein
MDSNNSGYEIARRLEKPGPRKKSGLVLEKIRT